ncbi:lysophospholipase-like protein 1 isoform X1 [Leptinotarsa decemlineata]|uniref:lysophospholipase-like protein 1 isoform X1 n=2 Tax=Leptinotarsa decemlineata TaxID=7539 RepID=UPI003D305681
MTLSPLHLIKSTQLICSAAIIFLHGSDSSGPEISNLITSLVGNSSFPSHINFYFPTAPARFYMPLQKITNVWFNRYNITPGDPEDSDGIEESAEEIKKLIYEIIEMDEVPVNRIVVGGFSMGGAQALHMAYRFTPGVAGVFALSSFLNNDSAIFGNEKIPDIPLHMSHGKQDPFIFFPWGFETFEKLTKLGVRNAEFVGINNSSHELKKNELLGLFDWIQNIVPPLEDNESNDI